jgi:hypothetical protein
MRIAYLILAHRQPQHVGALINQLDDGNARVFLHIVAKSDIAAFRQAIRSERAVLLDQRLPIHWGGWNMVQATLDLLRRAHQEGESTYYQLLSDSCYPLKSNVEIATKLGGGDFNYLTINELMKPGSDFNYRLIYRPSDLAADVTAVGKSDSQQTKGPRPISIGSSNMHAGNRTD